LVRLSILVFAIASAMSIVSCAAPAAQPSALTPPTTATAQPSATTQPTAVPVSPTVATAPAQSSATLPSTKAPVQPSATTQPTAAPLKAVTQTPTSGVQKLNLDDYFPPGAGRDLVLQNCTACHSIVPIVTGQRTKDRWLNIKIDHADKLGSLTESDATIIFDYLAANFNDSKPEPQLPDWYLQQQSSTGE
jgi:hypothetical protein